MHFQDEIIGLKKKKKKKGRDVLLYLKLKQTETQELVIFWQTDKTSVTARHDAKRLGVVVGGGEIALTAAKARGEESVGPNSNCLSTTGSV